MKITYELEFEMPEDVPAAEVKALLGGIKSGTLGLLRDHPEWKARFRLPLSGVEGRDGDTTGR